MIIKCPHCGKPVPVKGIGRKPLGIPVKIVCDTVQAHSTVSAAALELGCSRGYIYKILKDARLTVKEVRG
jgi:hypothetical protein